MKTADSETEASASGHASIGGGGKQFVDTSLLDTVKDIKNRKGNFTIADKELEADFLLVVLERTTVGNKKVVMGTLSVKEGGTWQPLCKLQSGTGWLASGWGGAAGYFVDEAEKCASTYVKKR